MLRSGIGPTTRQSGSSPYEPQAAQLLRLPILTSKILSTNFSNWILAIICFCDFCIGKNSGLNNHCVGTDCNLQFLYQTLNRSDRVPDSEGFAGYPTKMCQVQIKRCESPPPPKQKRFDDTVRFFVEHSCSSQRPGAHWRHSVSSSVGAEGSVLSNNNGRNVKFIVIIHRVLNSKVRGALPSHPPHTTKALCLSRLIALTRKTLRK
jgi:hypothetical protein